VSLQAGGECLETPGYCYGVDGLALTPVHCCPRSLETILRPVEHHSICECCAVPVVLQQAESREESLLLAKQLATTKSDLAKHKASVSKLSTKLETEQLLRMDAEQAAEQLKQRLEKLLEGSKEASKQRTELTQVWWDGAP